MFFYACSVRFLTSGSTGFVIEARLFVDFILLRYEVSTNYQNMSFNTMT